MKKFFTALVLSISLIIPVDRVLAQSAPISYVLRSEAVMMLLKSSGKDVSEFEAGKVFPDVIQGEWYTPYLTKGLELGMIDADPVSGLLYPHRSVTRVEFMKMMTVAFGATKDISYGYSDIPSFAWYTPYVGLAYRYTLFEGSDENLLQPNLRVSHAEASNAVLKLITAEPFLQSRTGSYYFKPAPKSTTPSAVSETATQSVVNTIMSTPQKVKEAMLQLIRSRGGSAEATKLQIVEELNKRRALYSLPSVRENYYLELAAQNHAKDMATRGYFSHFTPEGLNYVDRIRASGYLDVNPESCHCSQQFNLDDHVVQVGQDYLITGIEECDCTPKFSMGENLAKGQLTPAQATEDWMDSPSHRMNMLRTEFEEVGVGIFDDIWVTKFGALRFD